VSEHLLVTAVENRFIAIGASDATLQIVNDGNLRYAANEGRRASMGADSIGWALCPGGFGEGAIGGSEGGDEDLRWMRLTGFQVDDIYCRRGIIDEDFLSGAMSLAHAETQAAAVILIEFGKTAVAVMLVRVLSGVLFPQ
jgi:hypothetical protein